jgi:hypothetical protein
MAHILQTRLQILLVLQPGAELADLASAPAWSGRGEIDMLWTIAVVLLVLWAIGFFGVHMFGGFIHLLLLLAVAVILINLIQGRRTTV